MAVRLDAAADRLTHLGAYPLTTAGFTYTAWVRIDVDRNDYSTWLRLSGSLGAVATCGTEIDGTTGSNYFTAPGSATISAPMSSPTTGVWVPVAGTRNPSTGAIKTWIRPSGTGSTVSASAALTLSDVTSTPTQVCIGGRADTDSGGWFNGSVAHVRIWSAELTQAEIEAEWASAVPVRSTDLHSNWRLSSAQDLRDTVAQKLLATQSGGSPTTTDGPPALLGTVNLCPNPSADVDLTGWSGDLGIAASVNNQTANVIRATGVVGLPKATGFRYQASGFARSAPAAAEPGVEYTISWWGFQQYKALPFGTSYVVWYNASGGDISYDNLGSFNLNNDSAVGRKSATLTAPAGTVAVGLIQDGGVDCVLSAVLVEPGAVVHDYADGDTAGWAWDGTPGLSASRVPAPVALRLLTSGISGTGGEALTSAAFTPAEGERLVATVAQFVISGTTPFADELDVADSQGLTWEEVDAVDAPASRAMSMRTWISSPAAAVSTTVSAIGPSPTFDRAYTVLGATGAGGVAGLVVDELAPVDGGYTVTLAEAATADDAVIFLRLLDNDGGESLAMPAGWTVENAGYLGTAWQVETAGSTVEVADTNVTPNGQYKAATAAFVLRAGAYVAPEPTEVVVDVGQAVEVELAQPLGRAKVVPLGQAVELGTARTVGRVKTRGVAAAVELSAAAALTARHITRRVLGQAVEDALAGAWARTKLRALGRAGELGTAGRVRSAGRVTPPTVLTAANTPTATLTTANGGRSTLEARHG